MKAIESTPHTSTNERDQKTASDSGPLPWWSRRQKLIVFGIILAVIVPGIALGLGLGLGLRHSSTDSSGASNTPSQIPSATSTPSATPSAVWIPSVNASWQIVLSKTVHIEYSSPSITPDVDVFDIDMFLHQNNTVINSLHILGKKVICYFSAGSYEPNRPDSSKFAQSDLGSELDGWPGEYWLNISSPRIRSIMAARIEIARQIGCDAIDPDNVDGFQNSNGLGLTANDSVAFMQFLAGEASTRNLGIGLKNAGGIIPRVLHLVHFSVNEQCAEYNECDTFTPFIEAGKPVFHIEYPSGAPESIGASSQTNACTAKGADQFSTLLKDMDLDGWAEYCNGKSANTSVF